MDKKAFSEIEERLLEVNKVIGKLDPSIRAAVFDLLKPYISSGVARLPADPGKPPSDQPPADVSELIEKHGNKKPHENLNLLAAVWFSQYGSNPFSTDYIREQATSTGLTIPGRPDMTLRQAKEKGKALYVSPSRGLFKPTVSGEAFLRATYSVKKGTKAPPPPEK